MGLIINLTNTNASQVIGMGVDGKWQVSVVVKASYEWDQDGTLRVLEAQPIVDQDEFAGAPDDACVILEESDCVYSVKIRKAPFRSIYLTQPRHGDEAGPLAVNVARFLGIEVEDRRNGVRWVP
jgi:nitrous oxide reductase